MDSTVGSDRLESALGLGLADAVPLAYAMVDALSHRLGIRTLLFKGPIAIAQQFRDSKVSSDVDVIVEAGRHGELIDALGEWGWRPRREARAPRYFPTHSITLLHPSWPCDIDVHLRYPGFFAADDVVFEELWRHRTLCVVAGRDVTCTDELGSGLILAAHAYRDPSRPQSATDLAAVAAVLGPVAEADGGVSILASATTLRAVTTLRPLLTTLGLEPGASDLTPDELRSWNLVVAGSGSTAFHWWIAFREARVLERPGIVISAIRALVEGRTAAAEQAVIVTATPKRSALRRLRDALDDIRRSNRALRSRESSTK